MIRIGFALSFFLFLSFSQAHGQIRELVKTFGAFEQKGQFDDAAKAALPIIAHWKKLGVTDSTNYYRYKRIHMLGRGSHYIEAIGEMKPLINEPEALPALPSYMGQVYYSAARDQLFQVDFAKAELFCDKSIGFESSRPIQIP